MTSLFKLNYQAAPLDTRDYIIKIQNNSTNLPQSVDLSNNSPVKNQGSVGSCTAFAGCAMNEFVCIKNNISPVDFSEKFLYYTTRVNVMKWPSNEDTGATVRDTLKAMNKYGICNEMSFPYLREDEKECSFGDIPPPSSYLEAKNYLSTNYANIPLEVSNQTKVLENMKFLLNSGYPFMAGFYAFENIFNDINGTIPEPQGNIIGGHAVLFVGYDDEKSLLKFKNSWGNDWGNNGYGYLPYSFVLNKYLFDIWTVYNVSHNDKPFEVLVPKDRIDEYDNRLKDITTKVLNGVSLPLLHQDINNNSRNNLLYKSDVSQLINFASQLYMSYNHSKNMIEKNRP